MPKDSRGYFRETGKVDGVAYDVRAKTKAELREKVRAKIEEIQNGQRSKEIPASITVQEWGERWRTTYKTSLTPAQRDMLGGRLKNHVYPQIGYMEIRKVSPINCQETLNAMSGKATDTIKKVRQALYNMFEAARENHVIRENPAAKLTLPATSPIKPHRAITAREREIVLRTAETHPAGAWVLTLLYAGLRPEESIVLRGADIADGRIHIDKAYDRQARGVKPPKSAAGYRSIPIIPPLARALPHVEPFAPVFVGLRGAPLDDKAMYRLWRSFKAAMAVTEAQLVAERRIPALADEAPPLEPYDLRHTFCTDLERAGVPITVAAKLMGHSKIEITARIYTHTGEDMIEQAGRLLAQLLSPIDSPRNKPKKYVIKRKICTRAQNRNTA